jgi:chromatin assembly factor 1 subunit A
MITALQKQETNQNYESDLIKLSEKLGKVLTEADIRLLIDGLLQKNGAEMYVSKNVLFFVYFK